MFCPECAQLNLQKLEELKEPIACIDAIHSSKAAEKGTPNDAWGMVSKLAICNGARVMLTWNMCASKGLCNGSLGTVKAIIYKPGEKPPHLPKAVIVQFDHFTGESILPDCPRCVAITPFSAEWIKNRQTHRREQIPLVLAWAITIHKSQGQTLNKIWITLGQRHQAGSEYVAVTRVRKLEDLIIDGVSWERFQKINTVDKKRRKEEQRLENMYAEVLEKYKDMEIENHC